MPDFRSAIKANKIPVQGIVPEKSGTAPTAPVTGQQWVDTSVTPNVTKQWDGTSWVPMVIYPGTAAGTYAAGNDTRITGAEQTANKGAVNGYAGLDANQKVAIANLPVAASGASSATNIVRADDSRLSDNRTTIDASVTGGPAATGVKIAQNTITDDNVSATNKDGLAAEPSMRTLGTGAQQAMAGNTRLDQISVPSAAVDFNGQRQTNVGAPLNPTDGARLVDIETARAGIDSKPSVRARSSTNVTVSSPGSTIDGVTAAVGDRYLLTAQTTTTENDIWVYNGSAVAMTRSADTLNANSFVFVEEGTSADQQWVLTTNNPITRGTTALVWTQFGAGGGGSYTGTANRITVTANAIDIASTYVGQSSITTLGTITTGVWTGTAIAVANGGTGATTAAAARTNLGVAQRGFAADLGALTAGVDLTVTHNLGTDDVIIQVKEIAAPKKVVEIDFATPTVNTVTVRSDIAVAANALRIAILPVV